MNYWYQKDYLIIYISNHIIHYIKYINYIYYIHLYLSHHFMANRYGNSKIIYLGGLQVTQDGDCSHEIKRRLLLGRKAITNLDSILNSRDITLLTKVCLVKAMVFPVVMYGCESWTIKKAERQRTDAFELWCWRRLESPLDCKKIQPVHPKGNQSWIKDWCWRWNSNTLATWCEELTHWKRLSCWERLKAGGLGDNRRWDGWMASPTRWTWVWGGSGSWWWTGKPGMLHAVCGVAKRWTRLSDWTDWYLLLSIIILLLSI